MNARIFLVLTLLGLPAYAVEKIEERADADPRGEVEVSNTAGNVTVTGWDRSEVEVTGELGDSGERLEFVPEGKHTLIKVIYPRDRDHHGDRHTYADLDIRIPEQSRLEVTTVSADITVSGVTGAQSLGTVSGTVVAPVAGERVEVRTVSGDARVTGNGSEGDVRVQAVSGDAIVKGVRGEISAASVSGDVEVEAQQAARLTAQSVSGNVDLAIGLTEASHVEVDTVSGEVVLDLEDGSDAEYVIETFSGDIDNCFGPEPQRTSQYAPGSELRFSTGSGSAQVRVNTLSGGVELCDENGD
ncbi:MAG: DUF4097 family beta strand repeat protein [Gammaproteobacteria bacterium]|nr:DUF4097 family beta strand repeat protein [Gammaproteobacteria bacterium]